MLRRADARGSADIIYSFNYRGMHGASLRFAGQALLRLDSRSRTEYLIPTNNIIVLNSYFKLTDKSNLIDRL